MRTLLHKPLHSCFRTICVLLMAFLLALPFAARADLQKGSRGSDVRDLQEKLIDLGFLEDLADGVYGEKTASAVSRLQEYCSLPETGILDFETEMEMLDLWGIALGIMEGDGLSDEELMDYYPAFCDWDGEDEWETFCWRHLEEGWLHEAMDGVNPPDALSLVLYSRGCALWYADILGMFDTWETTASDVDRPSAERKRAEFEDTYAACQAEWQQLGEVDALKAEFAWLEMQGIELCFNLNGEPLHP